MIGIDAGAEQVDVALDQHARLARAGGRFEDNVPPRIDRVVARRLVDG